MPKLPDRPSRTPVLAPLPHGTPRPRLPHSRPGPRAGQLSAPADVGGRRAGASPGFLPPYACRGGIPEAPGELRAAVPVGCAGRAGEGARSGGRRVGGRRTEGAEPRPLSCCSAPAHRATRRSGSRLAPGGGAGLRPRRSSRSALRGLKRAGGGGPGNRDRASRRSAACCWGEGTSSGSGDTERVDRLGRSRRIRGRLDVQSQ